MTALSMRIAAPITADVQPAFEKRRNEDSE
jgi:hypothetical protein